MKVLNYGVIKPIEITCTKCSAELEVQLSECKETNCKNVVMVKCCVCGNAMVLHREMFIKDVSK